MLVRHHISTKCRGSHAPRVLGNIPHLTRSMCMSLCLMLCFMRCCHRVGGLPCPQRRTCHCTRLYRLHGAANSPAYATSRSTASSACAPHWGRPGPIGASCISVQLTCSQDHCSYEASPNHLCQALSRPMALVLYPPCQAAE